MENPADINKSKRGVDSILIKSAIIIAIVLMLLIPSTWIQSLVTDREGYRQDMLDHISNKWSGSQLVVGPVLAIPYKTHSTESENGKQVSKTGQETLYVLPQTLNINGNAATQIFKSSIYRAVVYDAKLNISGTFGNADIAAAGIDPGDIEYDKASLIFGISDMKGLKSNGLIDIDGQLYNAEPYVDTHVAGQDLQANFILRQGKGFSFSYSLNIKGSNQLNFLPLGKTTDVLVTSDWSHPEFNGRNLPDNRSPSDNGFQAKWRLLYYDRPFPQQWKGTDTLLTTDKVQKNAAFGVTLRLPIDQYHEVLRTAKYSLLIIVLTFASLFLTELIRRVRIHVFNYILIGAAMVVYYTLLLSFTEQIGFEYAYLVSSAATIGLIASFTSSLLKNRNAAMLFAFILTVFYTFIYVIIQLEDYALLFGSVGLFIVIALLMYFSRKIDWDKQ